MRKCMVCGIELEHEWTTCQECDTPVPDTTRFATRVEIQQGSGETSGVATWSALLTVLGFCVPFTPFAAVPLGMAAMREIDESDGRMGGRGMAKFGIVVGGILSVLHVIVFALAMIPIAFGGPNLLVGITGGGEEMGLGGLKKLYHAEAMARFSVVADGDQDGLGEFVEIARLGEGKLPFLRSDLADGAVGGYWLMVVLPDGPDAREKQWWGIARPQLSGKGWRTFVIDADGVIRAQDTDGADPDLNELKSWVAIDMIMSRYDADVQAAQAEVENMQRRQTSRAYAPDYDRY